VFRLPTSTSSLSCTISESWRRSEDSRLYANTKIGVFADRRHAVRVFAGPVPAKRSSLTIVSFVGHLVRHCTPLLVSVRNCTSAIVKSTFLFAFGVFSPQE
jgi:hypothetical protein